MNHAPSNILPSSRSFRKLAGAPLGLLAAATFLCAPLPARADTATVNGQTWTYTISNGEATVTGGPSSGDIIIPSSLGGYPVTSIGYSAFNNCSGLTSLTIPSSVTGIGPDAFYNCSGLTGPLIIPSSVTSIGSFAFAGCSGLAGTLSIPSSVTSIGSAAFKGCSGLTGPLIIPSSVTSIGSFAFASCSGLTGTLSIPSSVTSIGISAFGGCSGLTSFSVGVDNANYFSVNGLLLSKDGKTLIAGINNDVVIPSSVTSIGEGAFSGCSGLTSLTIPSSVTNIGSSAFYNCSGLTGPLTIPSSVTSIGTSAFDGCSGLTGPLTIPASVTIIERWTFNHCSGLTGPLTIPNSVTDIGQEAFSGCSGLTGQLTIPASVTGIGGSAFKGCSGLTGQLTIPASVTGIGGSAFNGCSGLIGPLTIPASMTFIESGAFSDCRGLTSVTIPNGVKDIGRGAFSGCSGLTSFSVDVDNANYSSVNGLLLSKDGKTLIAGINDDVVIPASVTSIGEQAFSGCSGLTSLTIPTSLTNIGNLAFYGCKGLTSLTIPTSVTNIGKWTFYGCSKLKELFIPMAFKGTSMLTDARVPSSCNVIYSCEVEFYPSEGTCATPRAFFYPLRPFGELPTATRTGYSFDGWFTERDGQGTQVTAESLVEAGISTLYAKWTPKPYTVKFSANGGTGTMAAQSMVYGTAAKLQKNAFTREGFVFLGWAKTKTGSVVYGNQANVKNLSSTGGSVTLYAQWAKKAYKIAFDANGGTLPKGKSMPAKKMTYGKAAALQANAFTRKGYVFYGWSRSKTGKREFANKATVQNLRTDGKTQTLYAVWAKETYTVAFDSNGGKGKMAAQKMTFGKASNLAKNAFTKKGWLFAGWAKSAELAKNGKVAYKNGASVKNLRTDGKTTTLYAVWEKAQTVKFDANGGTCAPAEKDFKVGKAYGSFPTPEWKWRTFLGWFTASDGGEWVAETDVAETTAARKLFAHWEYIPVRLGETSKTVGPDAAEKLSVALSAKADWTASADAAWIAVRTKSGASGSGSLVFDVAKNTGKARTGRIIVSADGKAVVLTVSQKALTLALSASEKVFKAKAVTGQKLGVTATVAWTAKSSAKWLTVKKAKGTGNGTIVYELAANKGAGRAAKITVSGGGKKATFRVEQKGKDGSEADGVIPGTTHFLSIEPERQSYGVEAETNKIALVESDLSWKAITTDDWITVSTSEGSGFGAVVYDIAPNLGEKRSGKISVTGGSLKATLTIEQAGVDDQIPYLSVSPTSKMVSASAATDDAVWVEANVAWTAGSSDEWIALSTFSGSGNGRLAFSLSDNPSSDSRSGIITVFGGGMFSQVHLTQEGKPETPPPVQPFLRVNPQNRTHGEKAASDAFLVEANLSWCAAVSDGADWIVLHTRSGTQNGKISYSVGQNKTGAPRTGTITVRGNGAADVFTIIQDVTSNPPPPPPGPVSPDSIVVIPHKMKFNGEDGYKDRENLALLVISTVEWKAYSYDPWIHVKTTSGCPGWTWVWFDIDENRSLTAPQIGSIWVHSDPVSLFLSDHCHVYQRPKPKWLEIAPHSIPSVPGKGASGLTCTISTGFDTKEWTISTPKWIHVTEKGTWDGGGYWSGYIHFDVDPNPNAEPRSGKIVVSAGGVTSTCCVTQQKGIGLRVSPAKRTHSHNAAQCQTISVDSSTKWSATKDVTWINLKKSSGSKNGTIEYEVLKNATYEPRPGTIVVQSGWDTKTIAITQNAAPLLKVSPKEMKVPYKGLCYAISVKSNVKWKATSRASWITLSRKPTTGKSNGSFEFSVSKNTTGKDRKGTIAVTGGGITRIVTILQTKAPIIKLSPPSKTMTFKATAYQISVTANVKWKATSNADWLVLTQSSGKGNGIVSFNASENKTDKKRSAKITVTGGGKSVVFTLTQKAKPLPNLSIREVPPEWPSAVFVTTSHNNENIKTVFDAGQNPPPCIRFSWANVGESDTGSFTIRLTLDGPEGSSSTNLPCASMPPYSGKRFFQYVGLGSNGQVYRANTTPGQYSVTVSLDPNNKVKESNENDNTATVYFWIQSASYDYSYAAPPTEEFINMKPEAPVIEEEPAKARWVAVVASGGEDAGAVADGDEETSWTPDAADGAWCVLTFPEPVDATNAELVGDGLPEGTRLLFSEDSETWHEELPARVQYVWAVFPASDEPFAVREIRLLSK